MGGQKTMGVIHTEAFNFLKKNYLAMLVISLIVWAFGAVLGSVASAITAPISGLSSLFTLPFGNHFRYGIEFSDIRDFLVFLPPMLGAVGMMSLVSGAIGVAVSIAEKAVEIGANNATLQLLAGQKPTFEGVWKNFAANWKRYVGITAWSMLWVLLWALLFIIPGYIKSLSYRFAPYLMIQYPDMKIGEALKKSMEITNGYKGRLFGLDLILFGYGFAMVLLSCFVIPLLGFILWLPLLGFAMNAIAYLDIKRAAVEKGLLPPESDC